MSDDTKINDNTVEAGNYDASNISVLEGLEAVRKRPGMYIGSTGERGLHHLVYEVVDNSVDEALAGYATKIDVTINEDESVTVVDDGRGIPVEKHAQTGLSTLETVLTILHAGGKFGDGGYQVSGGLHGVGISVVNALSTRVDVEVKRDGFTWNQNFVNQKSEADIKKGAKTDETGTKTTFYPDGEIFETTTFSFETLKTRFQQMAFLNKGLKISLTDNRKDVHLDEVVAEDDDEEKETGTGNSVTFQYNDGLIDYVKYINKSKKNDIVNDQIISFEAQSAEGTSIELAMQWTTSYSETLRTFANTISTTEGGTHEEGFRTALTSRINKYGRDKGLLKEKDENLSGEDVREGLTAIISVKLHEPQFEGQTKTKLGNTEVRSFVHKEVYDKLGDFLDENPKEAQAIINKAISANQARIAARKARETVRRKTGLDNAAMPHKLKDCKSKDATICELFIVEGDSAGGSAIKGRNPDNQAILPLRGKILNVERTRPDKALDSETIHNLVNAIGTGTRENFDADRARYHKIVIMADADVDGQHICTLILTFLFRFMPEMINLGYIYVAMPPLYRLKWSNHPDSYVFSDEERDLELEKGKTEKWNLGKNAIQRYKGLGEMSHEELWETTMDPSKRTLKQVTMEDAAAADETFSLLMGDDVEGRRTFIQRNAKDVRFLDI
jgi:DNA gyrase subunit B